MTFLTACYSMVSWSDHSADCFDQQGSGSVVITYYCLYFFSDFHSATESHSDSDNDNLLRPSFDLLLFLNWYLIWYCSSFFPSLCSDSFFPVSDPFAPSDSFGATPNPILEMPCARPRSSRAATVPASSGVLKFVTEEANVWRENAQERTRREWKRWRKRSVISRRRKSRGLIRGRANGTRSVTCVKWSKIKLNVI